MLTQQILSDTFSIERRYEKIAYHRVMFIMVKIALLEITAEHVV